MAVTWNDQPIINQAEDEVERVLDRVGRDMVRDMRDMMRAPKSGRQPRMELHTFKRGKNKGKQVLRRAPGQRGFVTRRSAPGEAPAIQTVALSTSLGVEKPGPLARKIGAGIKPGASLDVDRYAITLEFGTSKIAARPYIRPAFERAKRNLLDRLANLGRARP